MKYLALGSLSDEYFSFWRRAFCSSSNEIPVEDFCVCSLEKGSCREEKQLDCASVNSFDTMIVIEKTRPI